MGFAESIRMGEFQKELMVDLVYRVNVELYHGCRWSVWGELKGQI